MKKRIYFVVHNFSSEAGGGVNRVVSETANELAKDRSLDINILSLAVIGSDTAYPIANNVKVHSLNMKKHSTTQYKGVLKLFWLISAYINVLIFYVKEKKSCTWNLTSPPLIILFSLFIKGTHKFINCEHVSPQIKNDKYILKFMRKIILNRADVTISLNKSDFNYYNKIGVKTKLIYNGINIKHTNKYNTEKIIIFVGRFEDQKDPMSALDIFYNSKLYEKGFIFKMYGYGKYHKDLLKKIEELNLKNRVFIITDEKNPENIYLNAYCLIMTSRFEGFGMVLIEAMSRGIPCIAYDCPYGPSDIIVNHINGYLIKPNDKLGFSKVLSQVDNFNFDKSLIVNSVDKFNISSVCKSWNCLIDGELD